MVQPIFQPCPAGPEMLRFNSKLTRKDTTVTPKNAVGTVLSQTGSAWGVSKVRQSKRIIMIDRNPQLDLSGDSKQRGKGQVKKVVPVNAPMDIIISAE